MKAKRAQIIQELRTRKSLNQTKVAEMLGVSLTAYQRYEHGTAEPTFDNLCKLAEFYGVSTDYLLGREADKPSPIEVLRLSGRLDSGSAAIVDAFCELPLEHQQIIMDFMQSAVDKAKASEQAGERVEIPCGQLESDEEQAKKDVS